MCEHGIRFERAWALSTRVYFYTMHAYMETANIIHITTIRSVNNDCESLLNNLHHKVVSSFSRGIQLMYNVHTYTVSCTYQIFGGRSQPYSAFM